MRSRLGQYTRNARQQQRLTPQDLARRLGYAPARRNKGARRIQTIEKSGLEDPRFIRRVFDELDLDVHTAERLAREDETARKREWEQWADEPIKPFLIVRYGPHWFTHIKRDVPEYISTLDEAEDWVSEFVLNENRERERPVTARLVWSRRLHLWFDASGDVMKRDVQTYETHSALPHGRINNKAFIFTAE